MNNTFKAFETKNSQLKNDSLNDYSSHPIIISSKKERWMLTETNRV